jgi:AbiV family abortive infection protein
MKNNNKENNVNLKKIERMAVASYQNALRLHEDAIMPFKKKRYPSAYNLSVHSLEEIGKYYWLDDFVYHSRIDGRMTIKEEEIFIGSIYHHRAKQNMFSYDNNPIDADKDILKLIHSGKLEKQKQESMYVGLPKIKNKIDLFGKISIPTKKITESHAIKQITFINDFIICHIAGFKKGAYFEDIEEVENILDYNLMNRLLKIWPHMSNSAKKRYTYFMKHPDVEYI